MTIIQFQTTLTFSELKIEIRDLQLVEYLKY